MPTNYVASLYASLNSEDHRNTLALVDSPLWQELPFRLRTALVSAAVLHYADALAPAPTVEALLNWLDSEVAKRTPLLGATTIKQAKTVLNSLD